jgi:hypothetical protein
MAQKIDVVPSETHENFLITLPEGLILLKDRLSINELCECKM